MEEMKNLAGMFASIAELLQERDAVLMDKIRRLEARVEELEEKLKVFELRAGNAVPHSSVDIAEEESADVEVVESDDPAMEVENLEIAEDTVEQAEDTVDYGTEEELPADAGEVVLEEKTGEQPEIEIEFEFEEETDVPEPEEAEAEVLELEEVGQMPVGEEEDLQELVVDKARPDWYDWEVDIPGPYIEDIRDGIGLNDRILFLNELFDGDEDGFASALSALNGMGRLVDAVDYIRERYPQWDEESDEVYRFYMTVRRRFNKQIQES